MHAAEPFATHSCEIRGCCGFVVRDSFCLGLFWKTAKNTEVVTRESREAEACGTGEIRAGARSADSRSRVKQGLQFPGFGKTGRSPDMALTRMPSGNANKIAKSSCRGINPAYSPYIQLSEFEVACKANLPGGGGSPNLRDPETYSLESGHNWGQLALT